MDTYGASEIKCEVVSEDDCDLEDNVVIISETDDAKQEVASHTITYECIGNGEVYGIDESATYAEGDELEISAVPEKGYEFVGWTVEGEGYIGDATCCSTIFIVGTENVNILAEFQKLPPEPIDITFNPNGGIIENTVIAYTIDETYGELPVPERADYTFIGWYTTIAGGTKVEASDLVTKNITLLYAYWEKTKSKIMTITLNAMGGNLDSNTKDVLVDGYYGTLPVPSRTGYLFQGWYTKESGGVRVIETDEVITGELYAHWTQDIYYVNYYTNGGTLNSSYYYTSVTKNTSYSDFQTPTRVGYTFAGWYTAYTGGSRITSVSQQTNLYA